MQEVDLSPSLTSLRKIPSPEGGYLIFEGIFLRSGLYLTTKLISWEERMKPIIVKALPYYDNNPQEWDVQYEVH